MRAVFIAYRHSRKADALPLVAKKLQSSLAVEGELSEDDVAAYGGNADDPMLPLALGSFPGEEDADSLDSVLARAQWPRPRR